MELKRFLEIIKENNIPNDCILESDSGWECDPTVIKSFIYNPIENRLIGLQEDNKEIFIESWQYKDRYFKGWIFLK